MKKFVTAAGAVLLIGLANPQDAAACRSALGDFVWVDSNRNGIQDAGEPGINGVTLRMVTVRDHGVGVFETVTTNDPVGGNPGWYSFSSLDCGFDYTIAVVPETVPAQYVPTAINVGGDPARDSNNPTGVTVFIPIAEPGTAPPADLTIDFGYMTSCVGRVGDLVWFDVNGNGIQDAGEQGIAGALVDLNGNTPVSTSASGGYTFSGLCGGTYTVCVQPPAGYQTSPANAGADDNRDSDGLPNGAGKSCAIVTLGSNQIDLSLDFGFVQPPTQSPGTGTPGYWKNHPEAWPTDSIVIGGVTYTRDQAISLMPGPSGDKTYTLFMHLVAAKLNVLIGNDSSCISSTISAADTWMTANALGSGVKSSSRAWRVGEPLKNELDAYNNGDRCAPHRD